MKNEFNTRGRELSHGNRLIVTGIAILLTVAGVVGAAKLTAEFTLNVLN